MSIKVKGGKTFCVILIIFIVAIIATCATVPSVRTFVFNIFKSEEQKLTEKTNQLKQQIKQDDRYKELEDDNKQKVEDKFEQITNSDKYNEMTDEEKDEIVDKLIESEKIQQEVQKEQVEQETRKEELKQELEDLSSNKQELEQRVQDLKDSGASEEEIKAAEQEQQKVEEQIKAAEQEQTYYELSDAAKDSLADNELYQTLYNGTKIQKVCGIYQGAGIIINADILKCETIAGVQIYTQANAFCRLVAKVPEQASTQFILECISNPDMFYIETICMNKNADSHKQYFEQNKYEISDVIKIYEEDGCKATIVESWESENNPVHPEYLIEYSLNDKVVDAELLTYSNGKYNFVAIEKTCPEFWAQLEIEQAEAQNENMKNRS